MERIPPSQKIGKKLDDLLSHGLNGEGDVTSSIVRLGIERLVHELVEQEVTDYLERDHYQRRRVLAEYSHPFPAVTGFSFSGQSTKGGIDSEWLIFEGMYYSARTASAGRVTGWDTIRRSGRLRMAASRVGGGCG